MEWLRSHPYGLSIAGAILIVLIGALIVAGRSSVSPQERIPEAWSGLSGNLLNPLSGRLPQGSTQQDLYTEVKGGPPFHFTPSTTPVPVSNTRENGESLDELLAMLSHPRKSANTASKEESVSPWSFIPSGFISTTSPIKERSETQQKLFNYGNEMGSTIESFEEAYRNSPQILKDQFEDRNDQGKKARLLELASALSRVGASMESIEEVPGAVTSAHARLIESYRLMGERLSKIPEAQSDDDVMKAMLNYNGSVETFTKNYVTLATIFSLYGVTFSQDDPGKVFVFTNVGSL